MKFAYVSEIFPQHGETWIRYEVEELARRGHEVAVCATWPRPSGLVARVPVVYANEQPRARALAAGAELARSWPLLRRLLSGKARPRWWGRVLRAAYHAALLLPAVRALGPDLIVCHFAGNRALTGSLIATALAVPYLVITHARDIWRAQPAKLPLFAAAAEVWTISRYNVAHLTRSYPAHSWANLRHVPVGIDLAEFAFAPGEGTERRLVFTGRMLPQKGPDLLVLACAVLASRGWQFEASFLGDGPLRERLEGIAAGQGLGGRVRFLGRVPSTEVAARLRAASAFVLPCRQAGGELDGIPVALMEAMATGTPVVTTAVSGIPELVADGQNGILVPPDDPVALANGIERLWRLEAGPRDRLVRAARTTVEQHHDVRQTVDRLEGLALAGPGARTVQYA